ncbi:hypothetical protein ABZS86_21310 [Streptomyces sp. NPDC005355]|uniref:hypothetical protein n=1 Tax=Streptomyces sp. NPDC005355 TaxID=3157038 RepID=UPI0033A0B3D9
MTAPPPSGNPYAAQPQAPYAQPQPLPTYPSYPGSYGQPVAGANAGLPHAAPQQLTCRRCAVYPAEDVTIRSHQGMLVLMRFQRWEGPFCRTCGTAMFRQMTTKTLWQGWWSPFSAVIFNPFTIISNLVVRRKINKLSEPGYDQSGIRLDPGKPVLHRPAAYIALLPILWFLFLVVVRP